MLVGSCIESLIKQHVVVEWIVLGRRLLLGYRVVERGRNLGFVGEELAKLYVCRNRVVGIVVCGALCHTVLQSAEASRCIASLHIDIAKVGQLNIEVALRSPTSRTVVVLKAQLVDPHLTTLCACRIVAHTYNHSLHITKRRVADNSDTVLRIIGIVSRVRTIVRRLTNGFRLVTLTLQSGEKRERNVEHIVLGPHLQTVGSRVFVVVVAMRCELQRNLVLVEVVLVVGTEAYEYRKLSVFKICHVLLERVGMHKHL